LYRLLDMFLSVLDMFFFIRAGKYFPYQKAEWRDANLLIGVMSWQMYDFPTCTLVSV